MRKIKLRFLSILLGSILLMSNIVFAQTQPEISAQGALLIEASTGKVLYEKNADEIMYPASITKILTAIVFLEHFNPEDIIVVGNEVNYISLDSSKAGHKVGESITAKNLLRGLIIPSGNDTAAVVATAVAKKTTGNNNLPYEDCELAFSKLLNEKAAELGATNTNFTQSHGYHSDDHYTTAKDIGIFVQEALKNPLIKEVSALRSYTGNSVENFDTTGLITQEYNWRSHNLLITSGENYYQYATGMKTGFTNEAGRCVAATAEKDGVELIAIILNSTDPERWQDATELFEYGYNNYGFHTLNSAEDEVSEIVLTNQKADAGETLPLTIKNDVEVYINNEDVSNVVKETIILDEEFIIKEEGEDVKLKAPIAENVEVGSMQYILNGEVVAEEKIYSKTAIEEASIIEKIGYTLSDLFSKIFTLQGAIILGVVILAIIIIIIIIRIRRNKNRRRSAYQFSNRRRF